MIAHSTLSAVSRAILKLVYQFEIQNSNPKQSKVMIYGVSFHQRYLSQSQESNVLSYSKRKIGKKLQGFCPWIPLGRAYSAAPDSPAAQRFFSLLCLSKNQHPQKIAGYGIDTCLTFLFLPILIYTCIYILVYTYLFKHNCIPILV